MVEHWTGLLPRSEEVRERRDQTGDGLVNCKKALLRERIEQELIDLEPQTGTEKTLIAVLMAMLNEGII